MASEAARATSEAARATSAASLHAYATRASFSPASLHGAYASQPSLPNAGAASTYYAYWPHHAGGTVLYPYPTYAEPRVVVREVPVYRHVIRSSYREEAPSDDESVTDDDQRDVPLRYRSQPDRTRTTRGSSTAVRVAGGYRVYNGSSSSKQLYRGRYDDDTYSDDEYDEPYRTKRVSHKPKTDRMVDRRGQRRDQPLRYDYDDGPRSSWHASAPAPTVWYHHPPNCSCCKSSKHQSSSRRSQSFGSRLRRARSRHLGSDGAASASSNSRIALLTKSLSRLGDHELCALTLAAARGVTERGDDDDFF